MASNSTKSIQPLNWLKSAISSLFVVLIALVIGTLQLQAQSGTFVSGKVTDEESGKALSGASVSIPELRIGAVTDKEGNFKFRAPAGRHTIEVKYLGYQTVTRSVNIKEGETVTVNFKLSMGSIKTNEIVVVGLSGEVDKNKIGNSIASVGNEAINNVVSSTAIDALSGRVLGANVVRSSGQPGAGTYVTLRGRKTMEGSSEPLYVVDGVIIDNTFIYDPSGTQQFSNRVTDINPEDIEDMQILKGAAAAALYGAKAGNGVVIITTKRGKLTTSDKPARISFKSSLQIDQKSGKIDLQKEFGQTTPYKPYTPGSTTSWSTTRLPEGTPVYDHQDEPFRTAYSTENSLTISGGVPQFDYLINGTYTNNEGYVEGSLLQRTSVRANVGFTLFPGVTVQTNNNYIYTNNDLPQDGSNTSGILLGALRTPPEFNNKIYLEDDGVTQRRFASYDNPIWTQKFNKFNQKINRFLHSTDLKYMPLDWLTFNLRYGLDWYSYNYVERHAVGSATSPNRLGGIYKTRIDNRQQNLDFTFNLTQTLLDGDLEINLLGGSQSIWYERSSVGASATQTLAFFDEIAAGSTKDASSSLTRTEIQGQFAQLTSTFLDRYSLTLGVRRDGSSTFGESQKFHIYPKASLSYVVSNEPFFASAKDLFSNFRIRAAWGQAGSPDLPYAYATNNVYVTDGNFDPWVESSQSKRGGFNGIRSSAVAGAKDIKPELSTETEVGLDLGLFQDMINIEFSYFYSTVEDMIMSIPAPASTGYTNMLKNGGAMWNRGYELGLTARPLSTPDINWVTRVNFTSYQNEVTRLDAEFYTLTGGFVSILNAAKVGLPLGTFQTAGWLRYDDAKAKDPNNAGTKWEVTDAERRFFKELTGRDYQDGDIRISYWDPDLKKVINDDYGLNYAGAPVQDPDLIFKYDPNPDFMISWSNDFTIFENITFSFLWDMVWGFDVWNGTKGALYNFGTHGDTRDRLDPWNDENGHPVYDYTDVIKGTGDRKVPNKVMKYRMYYNGFNINEPHIEDGSFIKLREIRLDYRWKGLEDWNISQITFSFSARNLLTITDYKGYDPEVNTFSLAEGRGVDYFTLPQVRSLRFGLSINY